MRYTPRQVVNCYRRGHHARACRCQQVDAKLPPPFPFDKFILPFCPFCLSFWPHGFSGNDYGDIRPDRSCIFVPPSVGEHEIGPAPTLTFLVCLCTCAFGDGVRGEAMSFLAWLADWSLANHLWMMQRRFPSWFRSRQNGLYYQPLSELPYWYSMSISRFFPFASNVVFVSHSRRIP